MSVGGVNMPIMTVALNGNAASLAYGVFQGSGSLLLWSGRSCHVKDFFFQNRAMKIVHAITECDLCQRQAHAHPIGGDMIDVVQVNTADGKIAKLFNS